MGDKLGIYDLLATLVPGALIVCLLAVAAPGLAAHFKSLSLPDVFAVVILTAVAIFAGNVVQAVGSLVDPLLHRTWTGTWGKFPSELALEKGLGDRYLPKEAADRIRGKLAATVKEGTSNRSLFLYAMLQAEGATTQRVSTFNGLFAYHRALLISTFVGLLVAVAGVCGWIAVPWSPGLSWGLLVGAAALLWLFWNRTKQRSFYYVREILLTAERVIDAKPSATGEKAAAQPAGTAAPAAVANAVAH
jgi:hypothetical protein